VTIVAEWILDSECPRVDLTASAGVWAPRWRSIAPSARGIRITRRNACDHMPALASATALGGEGSGIEGGQMRP